MLNAEIDDKCELEEQQWNMKEPHLGISCRGLNNYTEHCVLSNQPPLKCISVHIPEHTSPPSHHSSQQFSTLHIYKEINRHTNTKRDFDLPSAVSWPHCFSWSHCSASIMLLSQRNHSKVNRYIKKQTKLKIQGSQQTWTLSGERRNTREQREMGEGADWWVESSRGEKTFEQVTEKTHRMRSSDRSQNCWSLFSSLIIGCSSR